MHSLRLVAVAAAVAAAVNVAVKVMTAMVKRVKVKRVQRRGKDRVKKSLGRPMALRAIT